MTRIAWGDPETYVYRLLPPDEDKINIRYSSGSTSLWSPTVEDVMALDWADTVRID